MIDIHDRRPEDPTVAKLRAMLIMLRAKTREIEAVLDFIEQKQRRDAEGMR